MNPNRLSRFERRVQALIEGGFARLFAGRLHPHAVALQLARAMDDHAQPDADGNPVAPNRYTVHLHPDDHAALIAARPDLPAILADNLVALAAQSDLWLDAPPEVELVPDDALAPHTVTVVAAHSEPEWDPTRAMAPVEDDGAQSAPADVLPTAFLLVDSSRYVPLDRTVINIGRRRDNTIVLENLRVSRQHAQIRFRFGEFVLYDLGSSAGTTVNGAQVSECVLRPGDVIAFAGVKVVYVVEDDTTGRVMPSGGDTQVPPPHHRRGEDEAR